MTEQPIVWDGQAATNGGLPARTRLDEARSILARLASGASVIKDGVHYTQCVLCGGKAPDWASPVEHTAQCIVTEAQRWLDEIL